MGPRLFDHSGKEALGAKVAVHRTGAKPIWRRARTAGSYISANNSRILVVLGPAGKVAGIRAFWSSGRIEQWSMLPVDRYTNPQEGKG